MYNNPFINNYAGFNGYNMPMPQQEQKQPINNIFTNQLPTINGEYFMAKFLKSGENPETIIVNQKTAFIDLENKKLSIKEMDGNIVNYEIILPLDEKDLKIQKLEKEIELLKEGMKNGQCANANANIEITEPNANAKKFGRK